VVIRSREPRLVDLDDYIVPIDQSKSGTQVDRRHDLDDVEAMITPALVVPVGTYDPAGKTAYLATYETEADTYLVGFQAHRCLLHCPRSIDHHVETARLERHADRTLVGGGVSDHPVGEVANASDHTASECGHTSPAGSVWVARKQRIPERAGMGMESLRQADGAGQTRWCENGRQPIVGHASLERVVLDAVRDERVVVDP
jgi:hypothetical protein